MPTVVLQSGSHGDWNVATPGSVAATVHHKKLLQRHDYRRLRMIKCREFGRQKVEAHRCDPHLLWQFIDRLLGLCRPSSCDDVNVDQFNNFFTDKA
jgi:hypothetical protein